MIKRILTIVFLLILALPATAKDVLPKYSTGLYKTTFGVYQMPKLIMLYKEPDENSKVEITISWTETALMPENLSVNDVFTVFIPNKALAFMEVSDETEDWVKVIYDRKSNKSGWFKKDDPYKFLTWVNFYNTYGRKYGLYELVQEMPKVELVLHSAPDDDSQVVARLNHPEFIKLNVIRGNYALVSVVDLDRRPKTGYIRWRSDDGTKYLFPAVK